MANISFFAGINSIANLSGSGLGGYGSSGFGYSVNVGEYQGRTYITSADGTSHGPEANNVKYLNAQSGILGQAGSGIALTAIPNYQATLQIHFSHTSAVQVQNVQARCYDRSNIDNAPSGVICKMAEIIHPGTTQVNTGSGDTEWSTPAGSSVILTLANSPGESGQYAGNGSNSTRSSTDHDHYLAISMSPSSIGSKTQFGLHISLEYL